MPEPAKDTLIDDLTVYIFHIIFFVILSGIFGILGTISNIINIIVFIRQGLFTSNSNVNLFFLAVSDLGVAVTTWLHSICFALIVADIPEVSTWNIQTVTTFTAGSLHAIFVLVTRVITGYVTFERFVCVVLPFRVKTWLTPGRSLCFNISVFVYFIGFWSPIFSSQWLEFKTHEETNITSLVVATTSNIGTIKDIVYFVNFFVVNFTSVIISSVCTVITCTHIKISKEWRKTTTSIASSSNFTDQKVTTTTASSNKNDISYDDTSISKKDQKMTHTTMDKETRLVKMITTIAVLFLICYLPELALAVMKGIDDRIRENGQYHRLSADVSLSIIYFTAAINSSINIMVYYAMSEKYRKQFRIIFRLLEPNKG